jgi:hypothetical protein
MTAFTRASPQLNATRAARPLGDPRNLPVKVGLLVSGRDAGVHDGLAVRRGGSSQIADQDRPPTFRAGTGSFPAWYQDRAVA